MTTNDPIVHLPTAEVEKSRRGLPERTQGDVSLIRVLLADDHPLLRRGVADLLEGEPDMEVVGEAADGEEAVAMALRSRPDVVLMDVTMPRLDGLGATRRIAAEMPGVRIIGLSMHEERDLAQAMRQAGATDYLTKNGSSEDLLAAIRRHASS
jgi:DNA-binding NarL/FixJ family response regulator